MQAQVQRPETAWRQKIQAVQIRNGSRANQVDQMLRYMVCTYTLTIL